MIVGTNSSATCLKHNCNVALKVLKPELTAVVGAERFLVEIKTTANQIGSQEVLTVYSCPHLPRGVSSATSR